VDCITAQREAKNTPECGRDNVTSVCIWILRKAEFVAGNVNPPVDVKFTCWHTKATRALSVSTTHIARELSYLMQVGFPLVRHFVFVPDAILQFALLWRSVVMFLPQFLFLPPLPYFPARVLQTLTTKHINKTCQYYMSHALIIHASTLATRVHSIQLITYNISPTSNLPFVVSLSVLLKYDCHR
jgi:hypothetical protein